MIVEYNGRTEYWNTVGEERAVVEAGPRKIRSAHGTVENFLITQWYMPPAVARMIHDKFSLPDGSPDPEAFHRTI